LAPCPVRLQEKNISMVPGSYNPPKKARRGDHSFRRAVLGGLGVVFPPLLTILIFVWVVYTTQRYVLEPVTSGLREALVSATSDIRVGLEPSDPSRQTAKVDGRTYQRIGNNRTFIPLAVYEKVEESPGDPPPQTGKAYYRRYVDLVYLPRYLTIPFFLSLFIVLLYLLGKFMAAGIGRFFWNRFEHLIHQVPLVRNVYSSVKQVSDFLFTEREIEYTRVVAVEYPRKGIWSLGLVTGDSMLDIRSAANEPVLSVLMPTSPMPVTGFTVTVLKSETIDLNITIEQAFQFIISCGVVVPPHQIEQMRQPAGAALPKPADSDRSAEPAARG